MERCLICAFAEFKKAGFQTEISDEEMLEWINECEDVAAAREALAESDERIPYGQIRYKI